MRALLAAALMTPSCLASTPSNGAAQETIPPAQATGRANHAQAVRRVHHERFNRVHGRRQVFPGMRGTEGSPWRDTPRSSSPTTRSSCSGLCLDPA